MLFPQTNKQTNKQTFLNKPLIHSMVNKNYINGLMLLQFFLINTYHYKLFRSQKAGNNINKNFTIDGFTADSRQILYFIVYAGVFFHTQKRGSNNYQNLTSAGFLVYRCQFFYFFLHDFLKLFRQHQRKISKS